MNDASSPPQPVTLTVHSVAAPDLGDAAEAARRRTAAGRLRMLLVLLVCAAPVVASYLAYYAFPPQARTNYGALIEPPRDWPADLSLRALEGSQPVAPSTLRGQWLLVVVGPAGCDAPCEQRLLLQRQLREMLGRERDRVDKLWLIVDDAPLRPDLRRAMRTAPEVTLLRAPREALARWLQPASGQALEDHLYIVDPRGQWIMRMPAAPEPARVKRDLDRLLRASSSWDRPGR